MSGTQGWADNRNAVFAEQVSVMRAAAIVFARVQAPPDFALQRMRNWLRVARDTGAEFVLFPELALGHYFETPVSLTGPEMDQLREDAQALQVFIGAGVGEQQNAARYSSYVLIDRDGSLCVHRKSRWQTEQCPISLATEVCAHKLGTLSVGVLICSESRFSDVAGVLAQGGAEMLVVPHAYGGPPDDGEDASEWVPFSAAIETTVAARARETNLPAVAIGAVGPGLDGGFALVDNRGATICLELDSAETLHAFGICKSGKTVTFEKVLEGSGKMP